jgi:hypothetical protein
VTTLYKPDGSSVTVTDSARITELLARGYTTTAPGSAYGKTVLASAARTTSGTSSAITPDPRGITARTIWTGLVVTAVSGTTPTLDLSIQWFSAALNSWSDFEPVQAFTQKNAVGAWLKDTPVRGDQYRLKWTIAGTTPSFTFSVTETGRN